jgi:hypothetical protein
VAFTISIVTASLAPGSYTGKVTVIAVGSGQANVSGSPLVIPVTLTVSSKPTVSVSGIVNACVDAVCTSKSPLPGASVTLLDSNGNTIAAATTDSTGNYILTSVPPGSYTLQVKGSDANNNHYMATMPLTVSNVVTGANLDALPSSS